MWCGIDPGGKGSFGLALLDENGVANSFTLSSVEQAIEYIGEDTLAVGIDAPLWWSAKAGGGRKADEWIRKTFGIPSGTVQSVNSLRGAAIAQGLLFADLARKKNADIGITECHPKALLKAIYGDIRWDLFVRSYDLDCNPKNEHERDAIIAAVCAREGFSGHWSINLADDRWQVEQNPYKFWAGPINYYWPDTKPFQIHK